MSPQTFGVDGKKDIILLEPKCSISHDWIEGGRSIIINIQSPEKERNGTIAVELIVQGSGPYQDPRTPGTRLSNPFGTWWKGGHRSAGESSRTHRALLPPKTHSRGGA